MRIFNIIILVFLLSAFTIGISLQEQDKTFVDGAINNASVAIENITLEYSGNYSSIPNMKGFFLVIEKYVKFVGTLFLEALRAGINFGQENPSYFEPSNLILIMKLIIWATIISLLIRPVGYLIIFIILIVITLRDSLTRKRKNKETIK